VLHDELLGQKGVLIDKARASQETPAATRRVAAWSQFFSVVRVESCGQAKLLRAEVLLSGVYR